VAQLTATNCPPITLVRQWVGRKKSQPAFKQTPSSISFAKKHGGGGVRCRRQFMQGPTSRGSHTRETPKQALLLSCGRNSELKSRLRFGGSKHNSKCTAASAKTGGKHTWRLATELKRYGCRGSARAASSDSSERNRKASQSRQRASSPAALFLSIEGVMPAFFPRTGFPSLHRSSREYCTREIKRVTATIAFRALLGNGVKITVLFVFFARNLFLNPDIFLTREKKLQQYSSVALSKTFFPVKRNRKLSEMEGGG